MASLLESLLETCNQLDSLKRVLQTTERVSLPLTWVISLDTQISMWYMGCIESIGNTYSVIKESASGGRDEGR